MNALHLVRPHAIMMVGIPGSGKTFFARQFADMFKIPYFDTNTIHAYVQDQAYTDELIAMLLAEFTKLEQTFIFEGDSLTKDSRTNFVKWAKAKGYQPLLIWVQTTPAGSYSRAIKSGYDEETFRGYVERFEHPSEDEKAVVISGRHTYATQAKVVLGALASSNRAHARADRDRRVAERPTKPSSRGH